MRRILIIDDERIFPSFERKDVQVVYARSSIEAIQIMRGNDWDEVWFDHDLGEGDDATKVLAWMRDNPLKWSIRRAFVHSMNPVGATNLRSRLKDFGIPSYRAGLPDGHTVIGETDA